MSDRPPHEISNCTVYAGDDAMPPAPDGVLLYVACAPGGSLRVRDDGCLRLGSGAEIRALEGGGFTVTVPGPSL